MITNSDFKSLHHGIATFNISNYKLCETNIYSLKYQRFTPSGCKDKDKSEIFNLKHEGN